MQQILVTAREAVRLLGGSPGKFLQWQDRGHCTPIITKDGVFYDLAAMRRDIVRMPRPSEFNEEEYATVQQALDILGISRRTFYKRVTSGEIPIHKCEKLTYVKLTDLYANDDLF